MLQSLTFCAGKTDRHVFSHLMTALLSRSAGNLIAGFWDTSRDVSSRHLWIWRQFPKCRSFWRLSKMEYIYFRLRKSTKIQKSTLDFGLCKPCKPLLVHKTSIEVCRSQRWLFWAWRTIRMSLQIEVRTSWDCCQTCTLKIYAQGLVPDTPFKSWTILECCKEGSKDAAVRGSTGSWTRFVPHVFDDSVLLIKRRISN